jgi:hypothetical protein
MEREEKAQLIEEINMEREVYLKKSKLASEEAVNYGESKPHPHALNIEDLKKDIEDLISLIGAHSKGGNSVEDERKERERLK